MKKLLIVATFLVCVFPAEAAQPKREAGGLVSRAAVEATLQPNPDVDRLRALGPAVLPHLAAIYSKSNEEDRAAIAAVFYQLGWKSAEAKAALLRDINTQNQTLRLQVQWALGRVSGDKDVVDRLATIMRDDPNPLFRDKAACALAYDQIHLSEFEKIRLYEKLIAGLSDEKPDVRAISALALQIHTGQTKGFRVNGPPAERARAIAAWKKWLTEYAENL